MPKTVARIGNQTGRRKRHVRQNFKQTLRLTICATVVGTILTVCFTLIFTLSHRPLKTWGWPSSPFAILSDWMLKLNQAEYTMGAHPHGLAFAPHHVPRLNNHVCRPNYLVGQSSWLHHIFCQKDPLYFNSQSWQMDLESSSLCLTYFESKGWQHSLPSKFKIC